jgi:hypothetical protein
MVKEQADPQQRQLAVIVIPQGAVRVGRRPHDVGGQLADQQFRDVRERV